MKIYRFRLDQEIHHGVLDGESLHPIRGPLFGDHTVLQQRRPVPVWGWAGPRANVTVRFAGRARTAAPGAAATPGRLPVLPDRHRGRGRRGRQQCGLGRDRT